MPILGIIASQISGHLTPVPPYQAYESIATFTGSGTPSSITFSSIPSTYKHLQIRYLVRVATGAGTNDQFIYAQFNGDTGSNYSWHYLLGDGATPAASGNASQTQMAVGAVPQGSATAGIFGVAVIDILDYASTSKNKTVKVFNGNDRNGAGDIILNSGLWINTSPITSINIASSASFATNSSFALYGIKG